jgi:hypothetical protein
MKKLIYILMIASVGLTGCNGKSGFQSLDGALTGSQDSNSQGGGDTGGNGGGTTADWNKVEMDGYSQGLDSKGKLVIQIDKANQALILILPLPSFLFLPFTSANVDIPDLEGAYFTSYQTASGDRQLAVSVPLKHVIKGAEFGDSQRLPNGDALPFIPAGELPGFSINFPQQPKYQVHVYVGVNVVAAFVELPDLGLPIGGTAKVKNKDKTKEVGAIGYIPVKGNFNGGLYLTAQLPNDLAITIDELIRW